MSNFASAAKQLIASPPRARYNGANQLGAAVAQHSENKTEGGHVDSQSVGASMSLAMCNAAAFGDISLMERLLSSGADVSGAAARPSKKTPLIYAAESGDENAAELAIEWLARAGADLNALDASGRSALMTAAALGRTAAVKLLLRLGAGVDCASADGKTALHFAAKAGAFEAAACLLAAGANALAVSASGKDPRSIARDERMIQLLLAAEERSLLGAATGSGLGPAPRRAL